MTMQKFRAAGIGLLIAGAGAGLALPAQAQTNGPSTEQLLRLIQQQQRQLDEMKAALQKAQAAAEQAVVKADEAKAAPSKVKISDYLTLGGKMEALVSESDAFSGANTSDITLKKVEAFIDAQPSEWVMGHVQFLYEDTGSETISLDEAYARLGNTGKFPLYVQAGKWAMPFGSFDTAMSTDPLTKLMGEAKEKAVLAGVEWKGVTVEGYVYNGDTQVAGSGNRIDQYGFAVGYGAEIGAAKVSVGAGYIRSIGSADPITDALTGAMALNSYVPGYEAHAALEISGFTLRGAYLSATKEFQSGELAFAGHGAEPAAWHTEISYTTPIMEKDVTFAATAQGTKDALALSLPERRYGGTVSVGVLPHTSVALEYLHDQDYSIGDGGTGNNGHTASVKLTLEY